MAEREDRKRHKRVEILQSAAAAFRRRGYHGATTEQIAHSLRMTKGSLYYYFKDKEEILFFCHDYSLDIILELLERVEASGKAADEKLRELLVAFVHMIIDELRGTALTLDLKALSPEHLSAVIAKRDRFDKGLRRIVQEGMDAGLFAAADPKLRSFAMLGAVNWISRWFDPRGLASSDEIARGFADYLVAGLRASALRSARG